MLFVYLSGVYTEQSSSSFFIIFMFHFFFQALIEWGFWYFIRMKRERKVIERGRGWFFYAGIKKVAAVLIKSSVYAGFSVVGMVKLHMHQVFF